MKQFLISLCTVAALVGCSTPVKLDSVPVEDRSTSSSSGAGSATSSGGQSTVAPVNTGSTNPDALSATTNRTVYFDYDSFAIRPEFQGVVEAAAQGMQSDKTRKIAIEGHTDERGGREYNLALGQKRADAVRRALSLLGVSDARMESVSFGKEKPAVPGASEAAMEKNRRAEIRIQ